MYSVDMRKIGAVLVSAFLAIAPLSVFASTLPCITTDGNFVAANTSGWFGAGVCDFSGHVGDQLVVSGWLDSYVANKGTYTITSVDVIGNSNVHVSPAPPVSHTGAYSPISFSIYEVGSLVAPPPPDYGWTNGGGAAATVTGIRDIVGANFSGLAVIAGLIIGVPLSFYVIEGIMAWFAYKKLVREHTEEVVEGLGADNVFIKGKSIRDIHEAGG